MLRKYVRYSLFLACLLLCMSMPFLMLTVEKQLEILLDAAGQAPCTVRYIDDKGQTVTLAKAKVSIRRNNTAVITSTKGKVITVTQADKVFRTTPASFVSRGTLYAGVATGIVGVLMMIVMIPLNAYLIQFSIEHTPDGRFHPFEAA